MACLAALMAAPRVFFVFDAQGSHALHEFGDAPRFAQITGLGVFEVMHAGAGHKIGPRSTDQLFKLVHG